MPLGDLLGSYDRLLIEHDGSIYQLRITARRRLILTKEDRDSLRSQGFLE
ncbi:MAG: hemin uptake protein HemP [Pseudomonadota bacterium]